MERIPDELCLLIFAYLRQGDRKNVRLVCQEWRRLTYTYSLFKQQVIIIHNYRDVIASYNPPSDFSEYFKPVHIIMTIRIEEDKQIGQLEEKEFWHLHGSNLRTLNIYIDGTHFQVLKDISIFCSQLEQLYVNTNSEFCSYNIDFSFFKELRFPKLLSLRARGNSQLIIPLLNNALINAPKLVDLKYVCGAGRCYTPHDPFELLSTLSDKSRLKAIDINCANVCNELINRITCKIGFQIESLSIENSERLTDLSLYYLKNRCKNLKQLKIRHWNYKTNEFRHTISTLSKLAVVSFSSSPMIDNVAVASLGVLTCLTHVNISDCDLVSHSGILELFGKRVRTEMIELRLVNLDITDGSITVIAPNLPNLKILDVSDCSRITLYPLLTYRNSSLQCLLVNRCGSIDIENLINLFMQCPSFFNQMNNLIHISALEIKSVIHDNASTLDLPYLKVLDISDSPSSHIAGLIKRCPSLKFVSRFCCQTRTLIHDDAIAITRRRRIHNCTESPLLPCYFVSDVFMNNVS